MKEAKDINADRYVKCIVDHDCMHQVSTAVALKDPQQCIEQKCPKEWAACQKDPKCQPALDDCMKKCGSKESCWTLCLSTKGSQAAIDTAKCGQANHCLDNIEKAVVLKVDPVECVKEKCPNEYAACVKDSKCEPTLDKCNKKCGTSKSCW